MGMWDFLLSEDNVFSETTCFVDHQAFISSSEGGVNLVQSPEEWTDMSNGRDLIVIKSKLQKHRKIADTNCQQDIPLNFLSF